MFIAETGRRVPLDDSQAARTLNVNINQYRKVLGDLLRLGKVKRHVDGYGNDRVESERAEAQKATDRKSPAKTAGEPDRGSNQGQERADHESSVTVSNDTQSSLPPQSPPLVTGGVTPPVEAEKDQSFLRAKKNHNQIDVVEDGRAREIAKSKYDLLADRLTEAAKPAIANPAAYPCLLNLSAPLMWLREGCDLELDILPTVAEVARRRAGKQKITSWEYFTAAVAIAKAKREGGLPAVDVAGLVARSPSLSDDRRPAWAVDQDRRRQAALEALKEYQ
jgi:uncharacterized protein YdaU (DUF1376 family)